MSKISYVTLDGHPFGLVKEFKPADTGLSLIDITQAPATVVAGTRIPVSGMGWFQILVAIAVNPSATLGTASILVDFYGEGSAVIAPQLDLFGTPFSTTTNGAIVVITFGRQRTLTSTSGTVTASTDGRFDCLRDIKLSLDIVASNNAATSATASVTLLGASH